MTEQRRKRRTRERKTAIVVLYGTDDLSSTVDRMGLGFFRKRNGIDFSFLCVRLREREKSAANPTRREREFYCEQQ